MLDSCWILIKTVKNVEKNRFKKANHPKVSKLNNHKTKGKATALNLKDLIMMNEVK